MEDNRIAAHLTYTNVGQRYVCREYLLEKKKMSEFPGLISEAIMTKL
jgi:hypothetical protein